ncbi:MAG: CHAD domain-containing protein [Anaerolineales bacterium]
MTLTPVETFWLKWHTTRRRNAPLEKGEAFLFSPALPARGRGRTRMQAQTVLLAATGKEPGNIAYTLKLKRAVVDRTLAQFESKRLRLFPQPALLLNELLDAAQVDMAHARQVADHAMWLFDHTQAVHGLPTRSRALLETMALLHNVGVEVDEPQHHTAGRDTLMAMKLAGYSDDAQRMIACAIRFHRKRARPEKEPLFIGLTPKLQAQTLALSAIVRIADGLDYSQSQTTRVEDMTVGTETILLRLSGPHTGPHTASDGERAIEKADLWAEVFGHDWRLAPDVASLAQRPLTGQSPMSHVVLRALADQLTRWNGATAGARAGEVAAIKALRAAARRARAAVELFQPFIKKPIHKSLRRHFKNAEDALAEVRDWDVLLDGALAHLSEAAFIDHWRTERLRALAEAVAWLESAAAQSAAGWEAALIDDSLRRKYDTPLAANAELILLAPIETLNDLAAALDVAHVETYHKLRRMGIKRCRFALEFLSPALGPQAEAVLKEIVKAQDRLGNLNDACVARERMVQWLADHPDDEAARQYALTCDIAIQNHLRKFPKDWEPVKPDVLREKLRGLVSVIVPRP